MSRRERERSAVEPPDDASMLLRALANEYRRTVVRSLDETHTPIPRYALATYVAGELFPEDADADFVAFRDRVLLRLHHVHLPLLTRANVIEMDGGQITPGVMFAPAVALLDDAA